MISLDWLGDPGYAAGPAYGIDAAVQNYIAGNSAIASTLQAVDEELDLAAQAMLASANPQSLNASHVTLAIGTSGTGANLVTLSDILISPSTPVADSLQLSMGAGNDYVYFYDNTWDGAIADLDGGGGTNTLNEYRGGNSVTNLTVVHFTVIG